MDMPNGKRVDIRMDAADDLGKRLGHRIRSLRRKRDETLEVIASKAGVSKGFLSKVERGEKTPAISTLISLAEALDTDVSSLLDSQRPVERVSFVKASEHPSALESTTPFGYKYATLAHHMEGKHMEPFLITLPLNPKQIGAGHQHPGEEFIFVLEGNVSVNIGDREYAMEPGDSIYFDSSIPHWGKSVDKEGLVLNVTFSPHPEGQPG